MAVVFKQKEQYHLPDLLQIMRVLRGEGGCPWDREQTHESIRRDLLEETYEVIEAIDKRDEALLKEELGDLLLQVVSHSAMEEEAGTFTFDDVADGICKKLIRRHPHVFADGDAATTDQVLDKWDEIKKEQKGQTTYTETLRSVPQVFPALMRAAKVQKRAGKSGFDYQSADQAMDDLVSETTELRQAMAAQDRAGCFEELGDLLFAAVNVARFLQVEPEECLGAACEKFINRFAVVEELAGSRGIDMKNSSFEQLDCLWKEAKSKTVM